MACLKLDFLLKSGKVETAHLDVADGTDPSVVANEMIKEYLPKIDNLNFRDIKTGAFYFLRMESVAMVQVIIE